MDVEILDLIRIGKKLSFSDFCLKLGIDIVNDVKNKILWNIIEKNKVIFDDQMLNYLVCKSSTYSQKKYNITRILKNNPYIEYNEIKDAKNSRKKLYVLKAQDFDTVMLQMRTGGAIDLRVLFLKLKEKESQYSEYEKLYQEYKNSKTEEERKKASERAILFENQLTTNVTALREISLQVAPTPINQSKRRHLGLFSTSDPRKWYLMRRQEDGWIKAQQHNENKGMRLICKWNNVSHSIDIGNVIKQQFRENLKWYARGNLIVAEENITDDQIISIVNDIVMKPSNCATQLANDNVNVLNKV